MSARAAAAARAQPSPTYALGHVLVLAGVTTVLIGMCFAWFLGGWSYYGTPLGVRGYHHAHRLLEPSGTVAHPVGILGLAMMTVPLVYVARKRWGRLRQAGSLTVWLEVHIYCGIVGPVLVTAHTAGRFNGVVSVAYWSTVLVVGSGFVGRYLYVRIPRTIRGAELGYEEIRDRATELQVSLLDSGLSGPLLERVTAFERGVAAGDKPSWSHFLVWPLIVRREAHRLRRDLKAAGVEGTLLEEVVGTAAARATWLARLAYLHQTRQMFGAWHIFHQPLVYVMFAIVVLHVGVAWYFGYMPY